jgi:hypothetical protein
VIAGLRRRPPARSSRLRLVGLPTALAVLIVLSACGGDDGDDPTPAPVGTATVTAGDPPTPAPTNAPPGAPPPTTRSGTFVGDGVCQARVPTGWVQTASGSGTTPAGNRFAVFGNLLGSEAAWTTAVDLFRSQMEGAGASVEEGDGWIGATYPDGGGFAHRAHFADRWCEVRLTAPAAALSESEAAAWEGIVASLGPVGG